MPFREKKGVDIIMKFINFAIEHYEIFDKVTYSLFIIALLVFTRCACELLCDWYYSQKGQKGDDNG